MRRFCAAVVLLALASGCRGGQADKERAEAGSPAPRSPQAQMPERAGEAHLDDGRVVRIEPEMLRDLHLTTGVVESRPGGEGSPVLGELRVNESTYAEIGAPVSARAVRILAGPGQQVRAGQVLAELQSLDLGRTRGEYGQAQARVELARRSLDRKRSLAAERITPLREVQEAEAELRSAEATLQAARGALNALGADPGGGGSTRLLLRTPVSGTVIHRHLMRGEVTDPSEAAFKVADLSVLWLVAHAPERDAVRIKPGTEARIAVPALPGVSLTGRVANVASEVDVSSRTIPVRIDVANPSGVLRPGMSATAWLPVGEGTPVLAVPAAALQRIDDKWCVFIPQSEGFEIRAVGRGRDLGGEVEILNGLRIGDKVVVEGAFLLKAETEKARGEGEHHDH